MRDLIAGAHGGALRLNAAVTDVLGYIEGISRALRQTAYRQPRSRRLPKPPAPWPEHHRSPSSDRRIGAAVRFPCRPTPWNRCS